MEFIALNLVSVYMQEFRLVCRDHCLRFGTLRFSQLGHAYWNSVCSAETANVVLTNSALSCEQRLLFSIPQSILPF